MAEVSRILKNGTFIGNETLFETRSLCTLETCDLSLASFTYLPSIITNAVFGGIFTLAFFVQLAQGLKFRIWGYMISMLCGLMLEIIGNISRVLIHDNPFDDNYFLIYLICLTIAPAFLTAAVYLCLGRIVIIYGEDISRLRARSYTIIFCCCDLISLLLQAAGGGIAASAGSDDQDANDLGRNIMMAGLGFQVFSLLLFTVLCAEFAWRVRRSAGFWNPTHLSTVNSVIFKSFLAGLALAVLTITMRSVYRCIELSEGFDGQLFTGHEATFMILEPTTICIAVITMTVLHPHIGFRGVWHDANFTFGKKQKGTSLPLSSVSDTGSQQDRAIRSIELQPLGK